MKNALSWFEIPVTDMKRAVTFYESVLGAKLKQEVFGGIDNALLPYEPGAGVGGALVKDDKHKPSTTGALIYLPAKDGVEAGAARAEEAGGRVLANKIDIGEHGFVALVVDTEGNRIGLHAPRA